ACSSCCRNNLGRPMQRFLDDPRNAIRFAQRSSRRQRNVDVHGAFVERREELTAHQGEQHERCNEQQNRYSNNWSWMPQYPLEKSPVPALQPRHELRVFHLAQEFIPPQQVVTQGGRHRQGDEKRGGNGRNVCESQWREHSSFESAKIE